MNAAAFFPSPERMRVIFAKDIDSEILMARARIAAETVFIADLGKERDIRQETDRQLAAAGMDIRAASIYELMRMRTAAESVFDATENHEPEKP